MGLWACAADLTAHTNAPGAKYASPSVVQRYGPHLAKVPGVEHAPALRLVPDGVPVQLYLEVICPEDVPV